MLRNSQNIITFGAYFHISESPRVRKRLPKNDPKNVCTLNFKTQNRFLRLKVQNRGAQLEKSPKSWPFFDVFLTLFSEIHLAQNTFHTSRRHL